MDIYMIDPDLTMADRDRAEPFVNTVKSSLEKYVSVIWTNSMNIKRYRTVSRIGMDTKGIKAAPFMLSVCRFYG